MTLLNSYISLTISDIILKNLNIEISHTLSAEDFSSINSKEEIFSDSYLNTDNTSSIISQFWNNISTEEHSVTEVQAL